MGGGEQCWLLLLWLLLLLLGVSSGSDYPCVSLGGFYDTENHDAGVNLCSPQLPTHAVGFPLAQKWQRYLSRAIAQQH